MAVAAVLLALLQSALGLHGFSGEGQTIAVGVLLIIAIGGGPALHSLATVSRRFGAALRRGREPAVTDTASTGRGDTRTNSSGGWRLCLCRRAWGFRGHSKIRSNKKAMKHVSMKRAAVALVALTTGLGVGLPSIAAGAASASSGVALFMLPKFTGIPPFTQADNGAATQAKQYGYTLKYGARRRPRRPTRSTS